MCQGRPTPYRLPTDRCGAVPVIGVTAGARVYSPGYLVQDKVVTMDTNVYSLAEGKLVWASRSATYNPMKIPQLVDEIATATTSEMKKQKLIEEVAPGAFGAPPRERARS